MRQPTPTTGSNPFLCGLIFFIFSEALSPMDWPSVRSPVRSERVSLPPRPFAHPAHSNATTPTGRALSQAPGVAPSPSGSPHLSFAFPCSPLHAIRPHEQERLAGRRAHGQ